MTFAAPAWAQSNNDVATAPTLTQQDFPTKLEVGSIQDLVLEVKHPVDTSVVIESPPNTRRAQLIQQDAATAPSGSELKTTLTLKYGFFQPGDVTLPAFPVTVDSAGATPVSTTPISLKVTPALSPGETLSAPQSTVAMWVDDYTLLWIGVFLLLVLGGGLVIWSIRRKANEIVEIVPPRPAYDVAIEKLLALESSGLLERGDYMVFYVRLSETLREYLGERYKFPGTELTTTEISLRLADVKWPLGMELSEVKSILGSSDLVKFGGVIPNVEQGLALLRRAMTVVELTKGRFRQPISSTLAEADTDDEHELDPDEVIAATTETNVPDLRAAAPTPPDTEDVEDAEEAEDAEKSALQEPVIEEPKPDPPNPAHRWQPPEDSP